MRNPEGTPRIVEVLLFDGWTATEPLSGSAISWLDPTMTGLKNTLGASLVAIALVVAGNQCGSSSSGNNGQPGQDAGPGDSSTADAPNTEAGTEPAYLRNDAIAGFAYTADYGSPYDSILGAPLNTTQSAIAQGFKTTPAAGQIVASEKYQLIANSADLYSALDISASLSVSSGLASVNAKTEFAQSTHIDSTDLWVLVDLSQMGTAQKVVDPQLTKEAAALGPEQFYSLYGDRYAAEIVTGAEMFCTVQIQTYSQDDKKTLTASLGFTYGASSGSASFSSTVMSNTSNRHTNVYCKYLGYSPKALVTDLASLLSAATAFQQGAVSTLGNVTTSALYLLYTSYYGIPGYVGVPAGTEAKVAQQAGIASDFLLYDSLVSNDFSTYYADASYSSLPFFAHMKTYRDSLSSYLTAAITSSQSPGVPVPAPTSDGVITQWVPTKGASSPSGATPQFESYVLGNGIVPKRISDYGIPLRYAYPDAAGYGTLEGTTFPPVVTVPWVASLSSTGAVDYPLYLVNKPGSGGGLWLEYQWDTGVYDLKKVTDSNGQPDPTLIAPALSSFALAGSLGTQYVVVSKANGLVMTDNNPASAQMSATHFQSGNTGQLWNFYLDSGANVCAYYVPPPGPDAGTAGTSCTNGNNYVNANQCGSELYGISTAALNAMTSSYWQISGSTMTSNGGAGCSAGCGCGSGCQYTGCGGGPVPTDTFFLQPYDQGTTQAIYNYAGSNGGAIAFVVTDPTTTMGNLPPAPSTSTADGGVMGPSENILVGPNNGNANALWVFIPATSVDTTP